MRSRSRILGSDKNNCSTVLRDAGIARPKSHAVTEFSPTSGAAELVPAELETTLAD